MSRRSLPPAARAGRRAGREVHLEEDDDDGLAELGDVLHDPAPPALLG